MALINHAKREINAKIVYYGCEGAGKRTSLQYIYDRIKPSLRGELKTLPTAGGSLLFFDFSPFEALVFGGYRVRFHIYTLPGKVVNPAAWKMTLKGADGLVVVADDTSAGMAVAREGIVRLRDFLSAYGLGLNDIPAVLQRNSFDRSLTISMEEFAAALDLAGTPTCHSVAISGEGVLETLTMLSRAVMSRIGQDNSLKAGDVANPQSEEQLPAEDVVSNQGHVAGEDKEEERPEEQPVHGCEVEQLWQGIDSQKSEAKLHVDLAGEATVCNDGVVRIPLEFTVDGASRRLVVSIAFEQS
jgi:signal recognition particle receptor subunit beta